MGTFDEDIWLGHKVDWVRCEIWGHLGHVSWIGLLIVSVCPWFWGEVIVWEEHKEKLTF